VAKRKRALVFGGSGQLGSQIVRLWTDLELYAPTRAEADVEDALAVQRAVHETAPDVVVNCTAFNDVPLAEKEPDRAFAINALAVKRLADICADQSCLFITFSTDYVFDGRLGRPYTEIDDPRPMNKYGESKLAGERFVLGGNFRAYVVRTSGVYGIGVSTSKGHTFIHRIMDLARAGQPLRIVNDQTLSPTYAADLAVAVRALVEKSAPFGLYHAANEGAVTWYDFAREALRQAGMSRAIEAISSDEFSAGVTRPKFSALENARLHELGLGMPTWREGLANMLRDKAALTT
jgi:dTDP-4-dehydrorhamnose reductase